MQIVARISYEAVSAVAEEAVVSRPAAGLHDLGLHDREGRVVVVVVVETDVRTTDHAEHEDPVDEATTTREAASDAKESNSREKRAR